MDKHKKRVIDLTDEEHKDNSKQEKGAQLEKKRKAEDQEVKNEAKQYAAQKEEVLGILPDTPTSVVIASLEKTKGNVEQAINLILASPSKSSPISSSSTSFSSSSSAPSTSSAPPSKRRRIPPEEKTITAPTSFIEEKGFKDENKYVYYLNRIPSIDPTASRRTISIHDLVTPGMERGLMTTYKLDMEWIAESFPFLESIPFLISHGESDPIDTPSRWKQLTIQRPNITIPYGVNHGKIMVFFYADFVRVVVSTANLLQGDYERKTQGIWYDDFPKINATDSKSNNFASNDFGITLLDYLTQLGVKGFDKYLKQYDFSSASVVLITSVPGYHRNNFNKYGHMKIRKFLENEDLPTKFSKAPFICQCSSLGSLNNAYLEDQLLTSFIAHRRLVDDNSENKPTDTTESTEIKKDADSKKEANSIFAKLDSKKSASGKSSGKKGKGKSLADSVQSKPPIKLIWPTVDYVQKSMDGVMAGGSLCLSNKNNKPFLSNIYCKYNPPLNSNRQRITPHIKSYVRNVGDELAWVCLTSANLSKAAWGEMQKAGTQFLIRNFEVGVLFLPSMFKSNDSGQPKSSTTSSPPSTSAPPVAKFYAGLIPNVDRGAHQISFPVPSEIPAVPYSSSDKAWTWDILFQIQASMMAQLQEEGE